jgi:hypothetical protein
MGIAENDAKFRETEKILRTELLFISPDTDVPLDRNPWAKWKGWTPAPYGRLVLTNERFLFLVQEEVATAGDMLKAVGSGVAKGALEGVLSGITFGLYDIIAKRFSRGKIRKSSVNFDLYKNYDSSFAVELKNIKGIIFKPSNFLSNFKLPKPFDKFYLTLKTVDNTGNEKNYCIYSNRVTDKKFVKHKNWVKDLKKLKQNLEVLQ